MGTVSQPDLEQQREYLSMVENEFTEIEIPRRNRKVNIGWLKNGTINKISEIMLEKGNDSKVTCKIAAAIILNGFWKIKLMWGIYWRWLYYVKEYTDAELTPVLKEGKKKVPQIQYLLATTLAIGMKNTMMTMKKEEVERFLQEQVSEQHSQSQKSTDI